MGYSLLQLSLPNLLSTLRRPRPFGQINPATEQPLRPPSAFPLVLIPEDHQIPQRSIMTQITREQLSIIHPLFHIPTCPFPMSRLPQPDLRPKLPITLPLISASLGVGSSTSRSLVRSLRAAPKGQRRRGTTNTLPRKFRITCRYSPDSLVAVSTLRRSSSRADGQKFPRVIGSLRKSLSVPRKSFWT